MSWTAVVPMKQGPERKSRLASRLSDQTRATLSDHMAAHVLECLHESPSIGRIVILSPTPVADARFAWAQDQGRGLNEELTAFRTSEPARSEEHTSELQSLMRISYAVFCLKKKQPQMTPHASTS